MQAHLMSLHAMHIHMNKNNLHIRYGCTEMEFSSITSLARNKYNQQKGKAKSRGIDWEFTLVEWWDVWQESGKWSERGSLTDQYAMGRTGDAGPYAKWNVYICTNRQNRKDLHINKPEQVQYKGKPRSHYVIA